MSPGLSLAAAVLLLLGNAFFVGAEFALISARRSQLEPQAAAGSRSARMTLSAMENVSLMMAGAQLGITVCSLALAALGEPALAHVLEVPFHWLGLPDAVLHLVSFVIAYTIITYLHVVVGEMVPKNLALVGPERAALVLGPPLALLVRVLRPVLRTLNAIANACLRLMRVQPKNEVDSAFTREGVADLVAQSRREGLLDEPEHELVAGALALDERPVNSVLLAPERIVTVPPDTTPAEVEQLAARTGFSRFPVRDDAGELTGYVHLKDVLENEPDRRAQPVAQRWIRPLPTLISRDPLRVALSIMQRSGAHLAQAVDSDGQVRGVASFEDVLAQLVNEVREPGRPER